MLEWFSGEKHGQLVWMIFDQNLLMAGWQLWTGWAVGPFNLPHYVSVHNAQCPCLLIVVKDLLL